MTLGQAIILPVHCNQHQQPQPYRTVSPCRISQGFPRLGTSPAPPDPTDLSHDVTVVLCVVFSAVVPVHTQQTLAIRELALEMKATVLSTLLVTGVVLLAALSLSVAQDDTEGMDCRVIN